MLLLGLLGWLLSLLLTLTVQVLLALLTEATKGRVVWACACGWLDRLRGVLLLDGTWSLVGRTELLLTLGTTVKVVGSVVLVLLSLRLSSTGRLLLLLLLFLLLLLLLLQELSLVVGSVLLECDVMRRLLRLRLLLSGLRLGEPWLLRLLR